MCSDTQRGPTTVCQYPGCTKTVWQDPDGSYSSFCGNAHRFAMANNPRSQLQMCKNCNAKPVYIENGRAHDFCGIRCAEQFNKNGQRPSQSRRSPTPEEDSCTIPGCQRPVYVDANGNKSKFCSDRHRAAAVRHGIAEGCLVCKEMPTVLVGEKQSDFCSKRCSTAALSKAPTILEIPKTNKSYLSVEKQFTEQWKHPTPVPAVIKIWRIYGERSVQDRFFRYQLEVERRTGIPNANTRRRFHGTIRACRLGDTSTDGALCRLSNCNMCSIIRSSFQLALVGKRTNFGRFGAGIYTSATSSKANDYCAGSASLNKAMLLNDVVLGKTVKLTTNDESLTKPPGGNDSVIGEPGGDLNYDESIGAYRSIQDHQGQRTLLLMLIAVYSVSVR
ncbi:hypothetical protein BJY52DRAFT_1143683 [Lactarius psammicola]|nr:hypothetical protein BJY52DRAFT_1143683 [Lactarius psammicola]